MKNTVIVTALMVVVIQTANAQWGNRNNHYDRYREHDSRRDNDRWDNDRRGRWGNTRNNLGDRIDDFQYEARRRIGMGIEQGLLTSREARSLMRDVERIERKEQIFWRDGRLDPRERRDLMEDLYALNSAITHEKRDNERSTYDNYGRYNDPRSNGRTRGW